MDAKQKNKIQRIKYGPPPPELPILGDVRPEEAAFIGRTNYVAALEEKKFIFGIKQDDRQRHLYAIGKSGVGKTKLLELLIRQDVVHGHGLCLIDPHGDLVDAILDYIPESRIDDVVYIDPTDVLYPISFNPLADIDANFKHQFTHSLIEVLERQFGTNWTPRLEHVFRFMTLALLDYPHATMRGMVSMLTDQHYRQQVIEFIQDDMVKRFWEIEFSYWSEEFNTDAIIPLVNKLGQFLADPILRNIFVQGENKIDFTELINEKKIILINLAQGRLGEENASFLGSIFVAKLKQAGMERATYEKTNLADFYLYFDEFQNLTTETFEALLSEARKYRFCISMAHRYLDQLPARAQHAILGNVGTMLIFRIGGEDAVKLKPEMEPLFDVKDMVNLGIREFYIKMLIDGEAYDPFSAELLSVLDTPHQSYAEAIIQQSRETYAIPVEVVHELLDTLN